MNQSTLPIDAICLTLVLAIAMGCSGSNVVGAGGTNGSDAVGENGNAKAGGTSGGAGAVNGALGLDLPLITPPVRAAAPSGLVGGVTTASLGSSFDIHTSSSSLDSTDIKQRFFDAGPTNIFRILGDIDAKITEINMRSAQKAPCLTQTPVAYTLTAFGQPVTFQGQCYDDAGTDAFFQFGQQGGSTYLYSTSGAEHVAARVTSAGDAGEKYVVDAWIGVGYDNHAAGGSYGAIALHADSSNNHFEMAVAGIGFGYCGAQLASDAMSVYAIGSTDMGSSCNDTATLCVTALDLTTAGTCDALTNFALSPLGRVATMGDAIGASQYPGGAANHIVLNGTPSDSLAFGPATPTPGVGAFGP